MDTTLCHYLPLLVGTRNILSSSEIYRSLENVSPSLLRLQLFLLVSVADKAWCLRPNGSRLSLSFGCLDKLIVEHSAIKNTQNTMDTEQPPMFNSTKPPRNIDASKHWDKTTILCWMDQRFNFIQKLTKIYYSWIVNGRTICSDSKK